ncbi:uncharacterized protein LOC134811951 [Bolinopsis microptera]|uniref:uncharacterized protein LOC134811951 n=1 Tax=Bolinopsis microptera TaxID=2820187 RepID=UPI00307AACD4
MTRFILPSVYIAFLCGSLKGTRTIVACYDKNLLMCLTILGPHPEVPLIIPTSVGWLLSTAFPLDTFLLVALQLTLVLAYSAIVWTLIRKYRSSKVVKSPGPSTPQLPRTPQQQRNESYLHRASTRSAEMMVAVCLSCIVTSLPASLYNLISYLFGSYSPVIAALDQSGAYKWIMWSYHISPAINPMIYAYFNTHLLTELKYLIICKRSPRILNKPSKIH